jgi:hypothetical protein
VPIMSYPWIGPGGNTIGADGNILGSAFNFSLLALQQPARLAMRKRGAT